MNCTSVSAAALLVSTALVAPAHATTPPVFSPAWFAQRTAGRAAAASPRAVAAQAGASLSQVTQSILNLQRAARAIAAAQGAQAAARAAALALPAGVPDGLQPGGLLPVAGATPGSAQWEGANLPTQTVAGARTTVTVQQTARQAVMTWQNFNVGRNTTLAFDQSAGGSAANTWVALNVVADPYQNPSTILGAITAPGQVYVLNPNGILFGATAQVNTGALIASAASLNTAGFLASGIYSPTVTTPSFTAAAGAITVQAGAEITTNLPASANSGGGFVLLLGTRVTNGGSIVTPGGQTVLAAGRDFVVKPGAGSSGNADPSATVIGDEVAVTAAPGAATNTGVIEAADGDVTMVGEKVTQGGVIAASTGLGQRGTVHLLTATADTAGTVTLAPGSVTAITIDTSSNTALEALRNVSPTAPLSNSATEVNNYAGLTDIPDLSRIEITSGGGVEFGAGSLALATSGQIAVSAAGTVLMQPGAIADVSGLVGVTLPQSANIFPVSVEPYNLRDSPVNRDTGNLNSTTVSVDARTLLYAPPGTADATARYYTGGGLLEVSGELGNVGHTIAEYSTTGGTVDIQAKTLITQPTSQINLAGGSIQYQAGPVAQTWLLGADGRIYNLNNATDDVVYTGVFNGYTETHPHWGVSETFYNPLIAPATIEESAYTVGQNAGSLILTPLSRKIVPTVLAAGTIEAGTVAGARQTSLNTTGQTGLLVTQNFMPQAGTLDIGGVDSDVVLGAVTPDTTGLTLHSRLDGKVVGTIDFAASALDAAGLGGITIEVQRTLSVTGALSVADGGSVDLVAPVIQVSAPITARSGSVTLGIAPEPTGEPTIGTVGRGRDTHEIAPGVVIDHGASIDTRGVWTNAILSPGALNTEAYINGGPVTITSPVVPVVSGGVTRETGGSITLAAGSTIDASAGGYVSASGKITGGAGGNITLLADVGGTTTLTPVPGPSKTAMLTLDGTLRSVGYTQGGTLTLQAPGVAIGHALTPDYAGELLLSPSLFASGFSNYVVTSETNIRIPAGTQLDVVEPVYQATTLSAYVPSGSDPDAAFTEVLPPLFLPNPVTARLTQRVGASLTLEAPGETSKMVGGGSTGYNSYPVPAHPWGAISLGAGAGISVDPGKAVVLAATLSDAIDGKIVAPGGTVEVLAADVLSGQLNQILGSAAVSVGAGAVISVAGMVETALDLAGRPYGLVQPGGTIILGNTPGSNQGQQQKATDAYILIHPGATLDASGAGASVNLAAGLARSLSEPTNEASGGGLIDFASYTSIVDDGTIRAAAGGAAAAGGTLDVVLESVVFGNANVNGYLPAERAALVPRNIVVTQDSAPPVLDRSNASLERVGVGYAGVSAEQVEAGGFGTLVLYASDAVAFRGDVTLSLPQSFILQQGALADTSRGAHVLVSAPYVLLAGSPTHLTAIAANNSGDVAAEDNLPAVQVSGGTLDISAGLLDVQGTVEIGADDQSALPGGRTVFNDVLPGFTLLDLTSAGDVRFLSASFGSDQTETFLRPAVTPNSLLLSPGSIAVRAAQVYPVTGATGGADAGIFYYTENSSDGRNTTIDVDRQTSSISIAALPGVAPPPPDSAFGSLVLDAPTIEQGGIVRAPLGVVQLGTIQALNGTTITPTSVTFLPGSITSISAAGASIPYGGSADGINYDYQGSPVTFQFGTQKPEFNSPGALIYGVGVTAQAIDVQNGATLDLQGGGTITGAAFLPGRGGSVDTLLTPLTTVTNHVISAPTLSASDGVYALLPGSGLSYAPPAQPDAGSETGSVPAIGQTVTVGSGVPGLPAGTYTLLPSYYALQPGGFRIELRTGSTPPLIGPQTLPDGSTIAAVSTGIANTNVLSAIPIEAIVTPGATVRRYTQYDEESYNSFVTAQPNVAVFGFPRPNLPADAGLLALSLGANLLHSPAFVDDGTVLIDAASGGYDGALAVYPADTSDALLVGPARAASPGTIAVSAGALDSVGAATILLGGEESVAFDAGSNSSEPTSIRIDPLSSELTIAPGASLAAAQVLLASNGTVTFAARSTVDTVGRSGALFDSATGLRFGSPGNSTTFAILSNGSVSLAPSSSTVDDGTGISVAGDATLYSAGVLAFQTTRAITLSPSASLGAADFQTSATAINVGDPAEIRPGIAPPGLLLSQTLLDTLLAGNPAARVPGLQTLELTATQSVNFFGSTQLNGAALKSFVLNTPGIYGYGGPDDAAVLSVGTLYWNGIGIGIGPAAAVTIDQPPLVGGAGPGTGQGTLAIDAQTIVFGTGPNDIPVGGTDTAALPPFVRAIFGFGTVDLSATQQIVAGAAGSLLVYQTQGTLQTNGTLTGTGGALVVATPQLTALPNGTLDITAGGAITLGPGAGAVPNLTRPDAGGGEIGLSGASIDDATAIVLPAGRALLTAQSDITLESGAVIDVAGSAKPIFDQTVDTPGGTAILSSAGGNIAALPGSTIAFGGVGTQAGGTLQTTAAEGSVALDGTLTGGGVDAADSGAFTLDANVLPSFAQLNQALTAGGVFGARSFEIGTGNLTIETADQLQARTINVSVDGGSLTVDGTIDAGGARVGTIALAGKTGLTLTPNAVLAAQGSELIADSYGQPIDASNRAEVSLTSASGTLALQPGATIALDSADGVARGDLELNAPRVDATGGGIAVSAPGSLAITEAATIALNGFWAYSPTTGIVVQSTTSPLYAAGDAALDAINTDSQAFEDAALASKTLQAATAGLRAYGSVYHLRPGVIIDSSATSNGDLSVYGDLDLSGFRYGPDATGNGAGEPGVLVLRAAGNLGVYGSISDGFAPPPATPDQAGWVLQAGRQTSFDTTVLATVTLGAGTRFANADLSLGYTTAIASGAQLNANVAVPVAVQLAQSVTLTHGWTLAATLTLPDGKVLPAGGYVAAGTVLPKGSSLAAGSTLPDAFRVTQINAWPGGASLGLFAKPVQLASDVVLQPGDVVPGGTATSIKFPVPSKHGHKPPPPPLYVSTRPNVGTTDVQGEIDALAPMLPAGSLSWSIDLVSGANAEAASLTAVQASGQLTPGFGSAANAGNLVLDDPHYGNPALYSNFGTSNPAGLTQTGDTVGFSVIRTGTGSLNLVAGGNVEQQSPYGIYTAGTQTSAASVNTSTILSAQGLSGAPDYQAVLARQLAAGYGAYLPTDGGDLSITVGGSLAAVNDGAGQVSSAVDFAGSLDANLSTGWLWEQGTGVVPASWWINFGSYAETDQKDVYGYLPSPTKRNPHPTVRELPPPIAGFTGYGTLGGGNLSVNVGGDAGAVGDATVPEADGLSLAVGSSGHVTSVTQTGTVVSGGLLVQQGGGDMTVRIGGAVLGVSTASVANTLNASVLTDIRGTLSLVAGSIGVVQPSYGAATGDPRFPGLVPTFGTVSVSSGVTLAVGDSVASLTARGDLALDDAIDPGRQENDFTFTSGFAGGSPSVEANVRFTGFSLWQPTSAIQLLSAGGNLSLNANEVPVAAPVVVNPEGLNEYPPILSVVAPNGNILFVSNYATEFPVEVTSSPAAAISLIAGGSIVGPAVVSMSGAPDGVNDLPNPFKPAFETVNGQLSGTFQVIGSSGVTDSTLAGTNTSASLYPFEPDLPLGPTHAAGSQPIVIYAGTGDVVDLQVGETTNLTSAASVNGISGWLSGSLPTRVLAGNDIVNFGTTIVAPTTTTVQNGTTFESSSTISEPSLFVNDYPTDISVLEAGRDIVYADVDVAGPGLLYVQAGRDLYQGNTGAISSLGQRVVNNAIPPSDSSGGAAITAVVGAGASGPDYAAFADLYFNDANQANLALPLTDPANAGKVQQTYGTDLLAWLQQNIGYAGGQSGALAAFLALPPEQQSEFALPIYFDELRLSGRQFTDPTSRFFKSYVRGKQAIATLFPADDYQGSLTQFAVPNTVTVNTTADSVTTIEPAAASITTNYGGAIDIVAPGGGVTLGTTQPGLFGFGSPYGVLTFGQGDVDVYSLGSVLLGTSRIFTTFGGGITIWSAEGNINAGAGTKSAVVAQPFTLAYDDYGDVTLSPQAPTTGAGIATLNEIPGTEPGDVDLIAPQGTIDAGEAGIRSSGNANLAALAIANGTNIQVQGKVTGTPVVAAPNIGALNAAAAAGSAAQNAAQQQVTKQQTTPASDSIITVEVLGFGGGA